MQHKHLDKILGCISKSKNKYFGMFLFRFWWLKIEACGEAGDWMELDRHCKSQKSPIGYEVGFLSLFIHKIRNTHKIYTNVDVL